MKYEKLPKEGFTECILCGRKTKGTAFCKDCWQEYDDEELLFILNEEMCPDTNELKCLICGKPSNNKHFCYDCWIKYKERSIDIRITKCKEVEILDEYGNQKIKSKNGVYVRSKAEKIINDFFFDNHIRCIYEYPVYYKDENGEQKELKPDFYLPDYELYIEYNGINTKRYLKQKEYAMRIYKEQNKKVLILTDKDTEDIDACLKPKLEIR